mgnify:CR=1 FL=1
MRPSRTKEGSHDYRYFPEPDLVPVEPPPDLVERLRAELPELPAAPDSVIDIVPIDLVVNSIIAVV